MSSVATHLSLPKNVTVHEFPPPPLAGEGWGEGKKGCSCNALRICSKTAIVFFKASVSLNRITR